MPGGLYTNTIIMDMDPNNAQQTIAANDADTIRPANKQMDATKKNNNASIGTSLRLMYL